MHFIRFLCVLAALALGCAARARADDFPQLASSLRPADFSVAGSPADSLLIVHYRRASNDYTQWNLWCWPEAGEGSEFAFAGTDAFGRYAIVPFVKPPARAGLLVRKGNWEAKDFDADRFVQLRAGGVAEVWVTSGHPEIASTPSAIETRLRVGGAFLDSFRTITLALNRDLTARQLKAIRVVNTRQPAQSLRVKSLTGAPLLTLTLEQDVAARDVAMLRIEFDAKESIFANHEAVTVFARGVLEDEAFTPSEGAFGALCTRASTRFATWSPVSSRVELLLYDDATSAQPTRTIPLQALPRGAWETTVAGDLHGVGYRYRFTHYGASHEAADMWAFAANADSSRAIVADLSRLEPEGFATTPLPTIAKATDEVIYEVHVRDYSVRDPATPPPLRGTYLGLSHTPEAVSGGVVSGIAHLRTLGVTAVHVLPVQDFAAKQDEYNWGYWTALFNVPESNYATNPREPFSAIVDLRATITALHEAQLRVILDVVYNHTCDASANSPFGAAAPYYFFRTTNDGRLMNDSGTGNALADERPMTRAYILNSLTFWLRAYKVDGFRFDLLGTHTPDTVRMICERVKSIRPDATLYGEPWTGGGAIHFGKGAQKGLPIAVFNDHLRNAIRGDLDGSTVGFATGKGGDDHAIRTGVAGAIDDFTLEPTETINYADAHDNLALWDKIERTQPKASDEVKRMMQKLALGIVLTSQGIPFLHGGSEFARTKHGQHNTYNAGDEVNHFDWQRKSTYDDVFAFTAGLVQLRRSHPAFRVSDDAEVRKSLSFRRDGRTVAFTLDGSVSGDSWKRIFVAYNDEPTPLDLDLPVGAWTIVVDATHAGVESIAQREGRVTLPPYSMIVAHAAAESK